MIFGLIQCLAEQELHLHHPEVWHVAKEGLVLGGWQAAKILRDGGQISTISHRHCSVGILFQVASLMVTPPFTSNLRPPDRVIGHAQARMSPTTHMTRSPPLSTKMSTWLQLANLRLPERFFFFSLDVRALRKKEVECHLDSKNVFNLKHFDCDEPGDTDNHQQEGCTQLGRCSTCVEKGCPRGGAPTPPGVTDTHPGGSPGSVSAGSASRANIIKTLPVCRPPMTPA